MEADPRRLSFGPIADTYDRYRPDYPREAVDWLLGPAPLRVLDVGAGTGKLTRALLAAGHDAVAVEPDPGMREAFAAATPGAEVLAGSAEELPAGDGAFDAVAAGQAFHWFDRERALPELARVLRPDGLLAVIANHRDVSDPWVAELARILRDPEADMAIDSLGPLFGPVERATFAHSLPLDVDALLGLVSSRSYTIVMPEPERSAMLAEVERLGRRVAGSDGALRLPYVTRCVRALRV